MTGPGGHVERLAEALAEIASSDGLDRVGEVLPRAARALVASDGATFVLREGDECHYVTEDAVSPLWAGERFPMGDCISGWVMLNGEPAMIPSIYADDRIPVDAYRPTFVNEPRDDPDPGIGAVRRDRRLLGGDTSAHDAGGLGAQLAG